VKPERGREWISTPDSEAIEGFGYFAKRRELEVLFKHGEKYAYLNVPRRVFEQLRDAPSRGHFVAEVVKQYRFEKR
jgi:hypothetical protein